MNGSPAYIHFRVGWQLIGPESPGQWYDQGQFRSFWDALSRDPRTNFYQDFTYRPDRCELGQTRDKVEGGGQGFSKVVCSPERLVIVEEWAELAADEFCGRMEAILAAWFQVFPQTLFIVQESVMRALVEPRTVKDSRQFLGDKVLQLGPRLERTFHGMPFKIGFNVACVRQMAEHQVFMEATVGSWRDNRRVWLEAKGLAPLGPPLNATNTGAAARLFSGCRQFVEDELLSLLRGYEADGCEPGGR